MKLSYNFTFDKHTHIRLNARSFGRDRSLFFDMAPWTPPTKNMKGSVAYYDQKKIVEVRKRLRNADKKRYIKVLLDRLLRGAKSDKDRVARICGFVSGAIYYNPIQQPVEPTTGALLTDPVELLELHDGRCGQGVEITHALLVAAGIESRKRNVFHHVTCEAKYDGTWHLADALMFGAEQPERNGEVVNVAILRRDPYFADQFPLRHFVYTPEKLLSHDGYRLLGYTFGDWGSLAYYSWYMGGELDYPPMLPIVLPPERLSGDRVRLRWAPSGKRLGGRVRYRLNVYEDRDRAKPVLSRTLDATTFNWKVPEKNWMYFIGVTAIDDHINKNPNTWYPEAAGNFVLVPERQYGWYGVL
jgi:hypothetical protein